MKRVFLLVFCNVLISQVQAQTYRAKNAMRTCEVLVPAKVVKTFKRTYPGAQIDSCYVYGDLGKGGEDYMFYSKRQNRVLNVAFNGHCEFSESETETTVEELPLPLQQTIAKNTFHAEAIGRVFKMVGHRRPNEVEYMVECLTTYEGEKVEIQMCFNEAGRPANPGFR